MPHPEDNSAHLTAADEIRAYEYARGQVDKTAELQPQIDAALEQVASVTALRDEIQRLYDEHMATHEPGPWHVEDLTTLTNWATYHGAKQHTKQGVRLRQNVELADGVLTVHTRPVTQTITVGGVTLKPGDWAAGGTTCKTLIRPGSRIVHDIRSNQSEGTRIVALLWPDDELSPGWPAGGELDYVECSGEIPDRQSTAIANHFDGPQGHDQQVVKFGPHDFTKWSRVVVDWTDKFTVTIDGKQAAVFDNADEMPPGPMQLAIQTAVAGGGHAPTWNGRPRTPGWVQIRPVSFYKVD